MAGAANPVASSPARETAARLAVLLCILLVAAMTALLWLHWTRVPEPTTAIMILGDSSLDGADVLVESPEDPAMPNRRVRVTLSPDNRFQVPVYRYPGRYRVTVTWQNAVIYYQFVTIGRLHGKYVELPTVLTILGDKTLAGAQVTLTGENATASGTLSEHSGYRLEIPVNAGNYRLSVTRPGEHLRDEQLTIVSHKPKEIDLRGGS